MKIKNKKEKIKNINAKSTLMKQENKYHKLQFFIFTFHFSLLTFFSPPLLFSKF